MRASAPSGTARRDRWLQRACWFSALLLSMALLSPNLGAEVERVEIKSRQTVAGGASFGAVGAYEKIVGEVFFALDPELPANRKIIDLDRAPKSDDGKVRFRADLVVLRPMRVEKGNGTLVLEVPNRGGKAAVRYFNRRAPRTFDPTTREDFGDGFLMRRGFTLAWIGWQADLPYGDDLVRRSRVPAESDPPLTGWVRVDHVFSEPGEVLSLGHRGHAAYPVSDPKDPGNQLTVREHRLGERRVIPRDRWHFARRGREGWIPDPRWIGLDGGFEKGKIYELVYRAEKAEVVGLGLAAVRDLAAHARTANDGPVASRRVLGLGISQAGRFLRHLLYQGFHRDERGRRAFDGLWIHTAGAGRGSFNHRFAQPSRDGHPFSAFFYPTDLFPFTVQAQEDPQLGRKEGLVASDETLPKIFFTNTGYEYWGRAAALIHTSIDGQRDLAPGPSIRIYHLASAQHFVEPFPPTAVETLYRPNPANFFFAMRGLLVALDRWITVGDEPPLSRYPQVSDGTLVTPAKLELPSIPGIRTPTEPYLAYRLDFGPRFLSEGIIDRQPPVVGSPFPGLVPQVDADGNELGGLRMPEIEVPIATYTPWNWRSASLGASDQLADFRGAFLPFPVSSHSKGSRSSGESDPRTSIRERYPDRQAYLARYAAAARRLVDERYLLAEDLPELMAYAERLWDGARNGSFR